MTQEELEKFLEEIFYCYEQYEVFDEVFKYEPELKESIREDIESVILKIISIKV